MFHNIGILAHVDAGKTTLTEQILYHTGVLRRAGSVDAGNTATDSLSIERQRGISVRTSTASAVWEDVTFNLIDTPGHVDFAGEVERCLAALDYAVVLVSAVEGIRAHTENILRALEGAGLPCAVFINKIDRAGADVDRVMAELAKVTPRAPILLTKTSHTESEDASVENPLSGEAFSRAVTEGLCEINAAAEEAFLSDELLSDGDAADALRSEIAACRAVPVLCGCAKLGVGVADLLSFLTRFMPSAERRAAEGLCGVIFKIEHDKTVGKISHVRLFGGSIANRDEIELLPPDGTEQTETEGDEDAIGVEKAPNPREKVSQIRRFTGGKYTDAGEVHAGDIAALCGLPSAKTGHFVGSVSPSASYRLATPFLRVRVTPLDKNDEALPRLAEALAQLSDEEPYIDAKWENGQKEIIINTTGTIQLEVLDSLLSERYGLRAQFSPPTVIYKETPAQEGIAYADYLMPKPCWAIVKFRFEPMPRGYGVSYHGRLPSNQCFYRYQSHIHSSFNDCLKQGLYGWEVTDFRCTLIGGEHHSIHTHPLDFFVCTPMAFMNGLQSMGVTLLEPMLNMRISVPTPLSGKVINEITRMGGEYDAPMMLGDITTIDSVVPAAASMDFPVKLTAMSSGKAVLNMTFSGYRECRDGLIHENPRIGVNPLDRSKWILWARGAYTLSQS
ncbi:MAG: TetM/TetW/TetO/TetS family tetracycline resistance ribosomal protection protein [Clostridia bacterium]|nr:TetM/TetW/TetO/TetS family tetracycline resistance ribosomal protection protein [Clostridia bacterium]